MRTKAAALEDIEAPSPEEVHSPEEADREARLVADEFPERYGFVRRIAHLWGPYFRVNYIEEETGDIPESHFLKVKGRVEVL